MTAPVQRETAPRRRQVSAGHTRGNSLVCSPGRYLYCAMVLPRTRGSGPSTATAALAWLCLLHLTALTTMASPAFAQLARSGNPRIEDARIPGHGEVWIQFAVTYENWSQQYAQASAEFDDGSREPLSSDYDRGIRRRYYPDAGPILADLNADSDALGFDPIPLDQFSQGSLDFGGITATQHAGWFSAQVGLFDRIGLDLAVPLVQTQVDPSFVFDPTFSTMATAPSAVPDPLTFFSQYASSLDQLKALIDGGTLSPAEQAAAQMLLADAAAFGTALERRVDLGLVLPLDGTPSGQQITSYYASLSSGFGDLGLALPPFNLTQATTAADLLRFFTRGFVLAEFPDTTTQGYSVGELEPAVKVRILDSFSPDNRALEARTAGQLLVRIPTGAADQSPYLNSDNFLSLPIGDGQWDVELALFQDVAYRSFLLNVGVRYGIQLSDRLSVRVRAPRRRFPLALASAEVERDLGDYFSLRLSPRLRLGDIVAIGAEYDYWQKGRDSYTLAGAAGVESAGALELLTSQSRHRLGVSASYSTLERFRQGRASFPVELWFTYQSAIAGGGGQTPASELLTISLLLPFRLFR